MASREQKRKVRELFLWLGVGWCILVIIYMLVRSVIEKYLSAEFSKDFAIGFSSAFFENLVFYLFGLPIAYFSIYLSFNDPKDGSFETRVKALTNSDIIKMDDELYSYLKKHFTNFLAFTKKMSVTIEVKDYNSSLNAYCVYAETRAIIANMCKDNDFETTETTVTIVPDVEVNGEWGTLIRLESFNPKTGEAIETYYNYEKITHQFQQNIRIGIPQNEEIGWFFEYIIWSKTGSSNADNGKWYFIQPQRFTRFFEVIIRNKMEDKRTIKFDARYAKSEQKGVDLQSELRFLANGVDLKYNESKRLEYKLGLYPDDKIEFFFYEPQ